MAISLGILFLPFGLLHWGYKNAKTRRSSKKKTEHHQSANSSRVTPNSEKIRTTMQLKQELRTQM